MTSNPKRHVSKLALAKLDPFFKRNKSIVGAVFILVFAVVGVRLLTASHAATPQGLDSISVAAPSNLQVSDTSTTQAYLTWTASTDANVNGYVIYQGANQVGTTKALTTGYLDTGLSPDTAYSFTVYAQESGVNSLSSNSVSVTTTSSTIPITSCGITITSPGNYTLTNSLNTPDDTDCITIQNANNVNLDCQNNTISIPDTATGLNLATSSGFIITNCNFLYTTSNDIGIDVTLTSASNGIFGNDTFGNAQSGANKSNNLLEVQNSNGIIFDNNTIYDGSYNTYNDTGDEINGNTVSCYEKAYCAANILISGSNNISAYNDLNGEGGALNDGTEYGTDDGYVLGNYGLISSNNVVEYNTMENYYDTGIETVDLNIGDTVSYNNISNAWATGIGGWYWDSLENNAFDYNTVKNAGELFDFWNKTTPPAGQSVNYFTNNSFSYNVLITGHYTGYSSSDFDLGNYLGSDGNFYTPVAANNYFAYNDFTNTADFPFFYPRGLVVDGGGNICKAKPGSKGLLDCGHNIKPPPPSNLTATYGNPEEVLLNWSSNGDPGGPGIAGYLIYRNGSRLSKELITGDSFADTTIKNNKTYTYSVKTIDNYNVYSVFSSKVTVSPQQSSSSQVKDVKTIAINANDINVSWSTNSDSIGPGIAAYRILRNNRVIATVNAKTNNFTDTNLSPSTSYSYKIIAIDVSGNTSLASSTSNASSLSVSPSPPMIKKIVATTSSSVIISWSTSDDNGGPGVSGYRIIRTQEEDDEKDPYSSNQSVFTTSSTSTSFTDKSVTSKSTYYYSIEAVNKNGYFSSPSAKVPVTTH